MRRGLTSLPKSLLPKYFYDARGSDLFECITKLPEYYLTRAEQGLITAIAANLMEQIRPQEIVELGPGHSTKTRWFLEASNSAESMSRYIPVDVNPSAVRKSGVDLIKDFPLLQVHGIVGDFERHLVHVPPPLGRRMVMFLGSTIGNLHSSERQNFLVQIRRLLNPDDVLLLGLDLVKEQSILESAYNDARGVTAEFNRNILRVINRALHADFRPEAFRHYSYYNVEASRIEMHLISECFQTVQIKDLGLEVQLSPEERIWTESSYKFTIESSDTMLAKAGLTIKEWYVDDARSFALALAAST